MLTIQLQGQTAVIGGLDKVKLSLQQRGQLFYELANLQAQAVINGTLAGIDIYGRPFAALRQSTLAARPQRKAKRRERDGQAARASGTGGAAPIHKPLVNTGRLIGSVHAMQIGAEGVVVIGDTREALIGYWQQAGTKPYIIHASVHHPGLPQRQWFGFRPGDKEALVKFASRWLTEIAHKAGF
jgi:hypothetical protein